MQYLITLAVKHEKSPVEVAHVVSDHVARQVREDFEKDDILLIKAFDARGEGLWIDKRAVALVHIGRYDSSFGSIDA